MNNLTLNDLRIVVTAVSFIVFIGVIIWAYSGRQRQRFEEAANLPFADPELPCEIAMMQKNASADANNGKRSGDE